MIQVRRLGKKASKTVVLPRAPFIVKIKSLCCDKTGHIKAFCVCEFMTWFSQTPQKQFARDPEWEDVEDR